MDEVTPLRHSGLSLLHERFVEEYVATGNATQAYATTYPNASRETARANGYVLLQREDVKAAVKARQEDIANQLGATRQWVVKRLMDLADNAPAPQQVRAVELIGKHHGMFTDRVEHGGQVATVFTLDMGHDLGDDNDLG